MSVMCLRKNVGDHDLVRELIYFTEKVKKLILTKSQERGQKKKKKIVCNIQLH